MNIESITMAKPDARAAFVEYRDALKARHTAEDEALMRGYKALAKGQQVIDLHNVMRAAGLDEEGRPRLAICRADIGWVRFRRYDRRFEFSDAPDTFWGIQNRHRRLYVDLPKETWPDDKLTRRDCRAIVPPIPPRFRPQGSLSRYHILWEAEWQDVPTDPLLLRHLGGALYAVLAQWDLSALERAVLRGRLGAR